MKITAIVAIIGLSAQLSAQTIYESNIPCGKVRQYSQPDVATAMWSEEDDTTGELSYSNLKTHETWFVSVSITPGATPIYTGTSEGLGTVTIDLTSASKMHLKVVSKPGAAPVELWLPEMPSSQVIPLDYLCFTAHRDLLAKEVEEGDSIFMSINHNYPVPAPGTASIDSLRFITAILAPYEGLPVDYRYPQDLVKNIDITYVQDYTSMYESGESEFSSESANWEIYSDISVLAQREGIMTWVEASYEYTGGAHGNYSTLYHIYDFDTESLLSLTDVFNAGYEPTLETLINKQLRIDLEIGADAPLSEQGFFVEVVPVTENFMLSESEISFHYNVYEIAPYVFGSITVSIPYTAMKSLIKSGSAIERMMK